MVVEWNLRLALNTGIYVRDFAFGQNLAWSYRDPMERLLDPPENKFGHADFSEMCPCVVTDFVRSVDACVCGLGML